MRQMSADTGAERAALLAAFRTWDERNRRLLDQSFEPVAWHASSPKSEYSVLKEIEIKLIDELTADKAPLLGSVADEKARNLQSLLDSLAIYEISSANAAPAEGHKESEGALTMFLVHGRDTAAREVVRRFLERVTGSIVVVLADQPGKGQTIIEKLETHLGRAAFVVVLMTVDDEGRLRGESDLRLRARQNVVFELGYAIGKLGRDRVCVLYEDGVELPSDYYGVQFIPFAGGWHLPLVAELKAAGINADANLALE